MNGAALSFTNAQQIVPASLPHLDTKKNLIELTKKSLNDEARIVSIDKEYSYASTSWLPIKSYYLLFNLMLTIDYLITLDRNSFRIGHKKCVDNFTRRLSSGEISFDKRELNTIYDRSIFSYCEPSGANLRQSLMSTQHTNLAMKKIANYKLEEWKRLRGIQNFRSTINRRARATYLQSFQLSIFEFPYYMRLRANYRDFAFIDGVTFDNTANYFNDYMGFCVSFYIALNSLRKQLIRARTV